jgi:carbon-monoxide dehydrogenase medium subunit
MKPVAFDYECPSSVDAAITLLAQSGNAKLLAGAQTLGPMLNLRLAQPDLVIDVTRIPELTHVETSTDSVTLGACITHAAIEDRRVQDFTRGLLPMVAHGIAYRAVRNRGTLGGSIAHADPSADWLSCFMALDAVVLITGTHGARETRIADFVRGALDCDLAGDELITGFRLPRLSATARCGYAKICRKEGEFADAIGVYVSDAERGIDQLVAGAIGGKPMILDATGVTAETGLPAMIERLQQAGYSADDYETQIHAVALLRAVKRGYSS